MNRRQEISLSEDETRSLLDEERTVQVATIGPDGWPHLVPMWFVVMDGRIAFWTYSKSQKIRNLHRDPRITCLVEAGERYQDLRGVSIRGNARLVEDPAGVLAIGELLFQRYQGKAVTEAFRESIA
ncbi:MAG: pyridoxamine 5'-phosphate oxidase family protein, partial [Gemmatimonadales bacterium]